MTGLGGVRTLLKCLVLAAALGPLLVAPSAAAEVEEEHYKCYQIAGDDPEVSVDLGTQFAYEVGVDVGQATLLCAPALKNGQGKAIDQFSHLKCYDIVGLDPYQTVELTTQFGVEQGVAVGPATRLCVPVLKEPGPVGAPPPPPAGPPPTEPHYECFQIAGDVPGVPVDLETQFGLESAVGVLEPALLCAPALKNGEGNLSYPHLECYNIVGDPPGASVGLTTQFGEEQVPEVGPAQLLCVQAEKVLPPVGGIAELANISDSSGRNYIALGALAAAALLALSAGGWYARRRLS